MPAAEVVRKLVAESGHDLETAGNAVRYQFVVKPFDQVEPALVVPNHPGNLGKIAL